MLEIGSVIDGKYKILSVIGHGGMSTVYLAINERANKPWAIKEVRKDGVQNFEVVRQSLMVETDMLKKLSHRGLPSIIDVIDKDDNFLIVMDYIEGITLKDIIAEKGAQKQEEVVEWAKQLCDVLKYLHERPQPIIYRDMKPANIMLKSDNTVTLIDFGTAREFKQNHAGDTTCLGTQGYAAPEQFGGLGQTDARTDIYCLGATIYHLVTGHNPSEPPYEMYPITRWNESLSTGLERIILKCTQKNPEDRYQTADELLYDLNHYKDLDNTALKQYKNRIGAWLSTLLIAITLLAVGITLGVMNTYQVGNNYVFLVEAGNKSITPQDSIDYYLKAIEVNAMRADAFEGLLNVFYSDGVFDQEEEAILIELNISVNKYLRTFKTKNPEKYADFCYSVGTLYWYYYTQEEARQINAVKWFQSALDYYEQEKNMQLEAQRCKIYIDIGTFNNKIILAQIEGTDKDMYAAQWSNLVELKRMNDQDPDRDMITLRLYREIVSRTIDYARYFIEDGVNPEDMRQMIQDILEHMSTIEPNATNIVKDEISEIRILTDSALDMIDSSSLGGK